MGQVGKQMKAQIVAITQPTFLPWMGWFDLADQVDLVIELEDVSFAKRSWQQRNRIRTPEGLSFLTVPVLSSGRRGQLISDTELVDLDFVRSFTSVISRHYADARYFSRYFDEFCEALAKSAADQKLVSLNCGLIEWLAKQLGVETKTIRASELAVPGKRGERLANLCERVGALRYISPAGAEEYLLEDKSEFDRRGISVELQVYEHPQYRQCFEPFIPYASALDVLFNEGDAAGSIMRAGRRPARKLGQ
ncbi:MAG TPA: WbqC family protein [Steroidobacteraceae bacterium]|jgi:hypothetical protein